MLHLLANDIYLYLSLCKWNKSLKKKLSTKKVEVFQFYSMKIGIYFTNIFQSVCDCTGVHAVLQFVRRCWCGSSSSFIRKFCHKIFNFGQKCTVIGIFRTCVHHMKAMQITLLEARNRRLFSHSVCTIEEASLQKQKQK